MTEKYALTGAEIFDGERLHKDCALLLDGELIAGICDVGSVPSCYQVREQDGGRLLPGYVDLQVNGGGGVMFNDQPTLEGIEAICAAHRTCGTTAVLVTLITDTPEVTRRAIDAGLEAAKKQVPGFLGLHLEGPHLSIERKGAHDPTLIRPMTQQDLEALLDAKLQLKNIMITVAPENVTIDQIATLSKAGIVVSLGHSDTTLEDAQAAINAGASCATHLFNAMSPLTHRGPGLVGATLQNGSVFAGLITDGFHVDPAAISIALAAKKGPGRIFLVSDAMSTVGTDITSLELNGRTIYRKGGRLTFSNGTLAGADLSMHQAVQFMRENIDIDELEILRMTSLYPAQCLAVSDHLGSLKPKQNADVIHQESSHRITGTWVAGKYVNSV